MDKVGYLFTRLRNAQNAGHSPCSLAYSNLNLDLVRFLTREGFIGSYAVRDKTLSNQKTYQIITVVLKAKGFIKIGRISRPSRRVYVSCKELKSLHKRKFQGSPLVSLVVSTSQGLLTNIESEQRNVGGEVLGYVL